MRTDDVLTPLEPRSAPASVERYRAALMMRFPFPGGSQLVHFPMSGATHLLSKEVLAIVNGCGQFKTLDEHAEEIARQFAPAITREEILASLVSLREAGGLVAHDDLIERCRASVTHDAGAVGHGAGAARFSWLAIPTRDRPDQLEDAIVSYVEHARSHEHALRVFVADGTEDAASRTTVRTRLATLRRRLDTPITYAGHEEKRAFAAALLADGDLPPTAVYAALLGCAPGAVGVGANRNAILLRTAGSLVMSVDDDTRCDVATASDDAAMATTVMGSEMDPTEFWLFEERRSAMAFVRRHDADPLAEHERLLGHSVSAVAAQALAARGGVDFDRMCPHVLDSLLSASGHVRVTFNGVVGDPGLYNNFALLTRVDGPSRQRLVASEPAYASHAMSRHIVRQAMARTITHGAMPFPMMFAGFDNRTLMPPFFPSYRNEDGLYALALSRLMPEAYIGHVPLALSHVPADPRRYHVHFDEIRVCDVVSAFMTSWTGDAAAGSVSERCRALGRHLRFFASLEPAAFREALRAALYAKVSGLATMCEQVLMHHRYEPACWANDLMMRLERLSDAVSRPEYLVPADATGCTAETSAEVLRQMLGDFAEVLIWWPAIVERARQLEAGGTELGTCL